MSQSSSETKAAQGAASHTPGPWVEFADSGKTVAIVPAGRDGDVCIFAEPLPSTADARLMGAAPNLLAEAKRDLEYVRDMKRALAGMGWKNTVQYISTEMREKALRAAIARATGAPSHGSAGEGV